MKAMILAAGFGTRLRPLTNRTPKTLLPLAGKPLIEWNLLLLRKYGIREVIINLHHLADQIEQALGTGSHLGMHLSYSREPVILGTGGGIKRAEPFFAGEPFLVLNGDTLIDLDLGAVVDGHGRREALATLVLRRDPEADVWGPIEVDTAYRVGRINGKGMPQFEPSEKLMFAGVHVLDSRVLELLPPDRESSIIDAYVSALGNGAFIAGHCMEGYWSDAGTPPRYEQAQRDVQAGLIDLGARVSPSSPRGRAKAKAKAKAKE